MIDVDARGAVISSRIIVDRCVSYENGTERMIASAGSQIVIVRSPQGGRIAVNGRPLSAMDDYWLGQLVDSTLSADVLEGEETRRGVGERWRVDSASVGRWFNRVALLERAPVRAEGRRHLARVRELDAGPAMDIETTIDASGLQFRDAPANIDLQTSTMHALFSEVLPLDPREHSLAWVMELRMGGAGTIRLSSGEVAPVEFTSRRVVSRTYRRLDQWRL